MMPKSSTVKVPLFPIFLLFWVLKMCHVVTWSWWVVTFPLWIVPVLILSVLSLLLFAVILGGAVHAILGG